MTADFHVRDIQALGGYVDRAVQWVSDVRGAAAAAMQRLDLIRQNGRMAVRKIECDVEEIEEELEGVESELASLDYELDCLYEDTDGQRRASLQCEINRVRARRREVQAKLSERKSDLRRAQGMPHEYGGILRKRAVPVVRFAVRYVGRSGYIRGVCTSLHAFPSGCQSGAIRKRKIKKIEDYDVGANRHGCVQESGGGTPESGACFDRRVERPSIRLLRADVCGGGGKFRS